jgi:hypothetical protein
LLFRTRYGIHYCNKWISAYTGITIEENEENTISVMPLQNGIQKRIKLDLP